jgi:hypothetical protein
MVTKKNPAKGEDPTPGPVTTSDMTKTVPSGTPEEGAAPAVPASKAKKEDRPQKFETSPGGEAMQREEDRAIDEMNDRRADARKAEEQAGAVPGPSIPQGPSALRDWQVSNNLSPQETEMLVRQSEIKQELRKDHHR